MLVVVDPGDYPAVLERAGSPGGPSPAFRFDLARKAFAHTAAYDAAIASTLAAVAVGRRARPPRRSAMPSRLDCAGLREAAGPALRREPAPEGGVVTAARRAGLGAADVLQGKELSFTNLLDLDAAARIVLEFTEPAAAVIKHTNPCGAATGVGAADAYVRAREADALSAFGGIVGAQPADRCRDGPRHHVDASSTR